eukprot:Rmarinus@m.25064
MNPEKMRSTYGKMMYMLMDSVDPAVREELGNVSFHREIHTVYDALREHGVESMLSDSLLCIATQEISPGNMSRDEIDKMVKVKEAAIKKLKETYCRDKFPSDDIELILRSIGDYHSYLQAARYPCDMMIEYLKRYYSPADDSGHSLAITAGRNGARLSHSHKQQYDYVLQSLTLWREVTQEMFMLWYLGERDLMDERSFYRLRDTGQGLNRLQDAPYVGRAMRKIVSTVQAKLGYWVGSSVVHLGDHNVPNAMMFIDKYTQVPRILKPIVSFMEQIDKLTNDDPHIKDYVCGIYGTVEKAKLHVLTDFFRHAFDGSGADNFFDAGSCIDGRLTSAWNWCSKIEKKTYFYLFLLTGFIGFDGDF